MRNLFLMLLFCACMTSWAADDDLYPFITCYDCRKPALELQLKNAATDAERLRVLHSLIMSTESDEYIPQFLAINKNARLIDDKPYMLLQQGFDAIEKGEPMPKIIAGFQKIIEAFDEKQQEVTSLLANIRVFYNVMHDQDGKLKYYSAKLDYYLRNRQFGNAGACYHALAGYYVYKGDKGSAINHYLKAAELMRPVSEGWYQNEVFVIAVQYMDWGNYTKAEEYFNKGLKVEVSKSLPGALSFGIVALAQLENKKGRYHRSLALLDKYADKNIGEADNGYIGRKSLLRAQNYIRLKRFAEAKACLAAAAREAAERNLAITGVDGDFEFDFTYFDYYYNTGDLKKAEHHLLGALRSAEIFGDNSLILRYKKELARFYHNTNKAEQASHYASLYIRLNDSLENQLNKYNIAPYEAEQKELAHFKKLNILQQDYAVQQATLKQRNLIIWLSVGGLIIVGILGLITYRQLRTNKKILIKLTNTQSQLVQSEKMASLGELTAGIAHEIQNPLNFVNNFSDVSNELISEMIDEMQNGDPEEARTIANDIRLNLEKIKHHGERADAIVKGMLQHSRVTSGQKEAVDINMIADEYLRLAYHGLRAKNKDFNAELLTGFDNTLPPVNVVPQDIGRVLLNLFTNAFYATQQRSKSDGPTYKPLISVSTSLKDNSVIIAVKDNGSGIPGAIRDKILQPFFTTKPTGEGTGLGLSLSYDIIVKGHQGEIDIISEEGQGAEFIIRLPNNT